MEKIQYLSTTASFDHYIQDEVFYRHDHIVLVVFFERPIIAQALQAQDVYT